MQPIAQSAGEHLNGLVHENSDTYTALGKPSHRPEASTSAGDLYQEATEEKIEKRNASIQGQRRKELRHVAGDCLYP